MSTPADEHDFDHGPQVPPPPGDPNEKVVIGEADNPSDKALLDATTDLIVKSEERGRETASTILGQIAVVGTFLGGFSLLNDEGKAAVLASDWSYGALICSGLAIGFALATQFLLPSNMPDLTHITELRTFWNNRSLIRQILLGLGAVSLGFAVLSAVNAFQAAQTELSEHTPAGAISSKVALANDAPGTVEAVATWTDLKEGQQVFACVVDNSGTAIAGGVSSGDKDGKGTITLSAPLVDATKGPMKVISAPVPDVTNDSTPSTLCSADQSGAANVIAAFVATS